MAADLSKQKSRPDLYRILDDLMKASEKCDTKGETEIFNQITGWDPTDIAEFTKLTNEVLIDLSNQYNYIKTKFDNAKAYGQAEGTGKSSQMTTTGDQKSRDSTCNSTQSNESSPTQKGKCVLTDYEEYLSQLEKENKVLSKEEKHLKQKLEVLKNTISQKELLLIDQEKDLAKNEALEDQYTNEYFDYKVDFMDYIKKRTSVDYRLRYIRALSNKLSKVNVFTLVFQITENKQTNSISINGFKLSGAFAQAKKPPSGKGARGVTANLRAGIVNTHPYTDSHAGGSSSGTNCGGPGSSATGVSRNLSDLSEKIDWSETNCAWGQVALLINGLLSKFSISKPHCSIIAMGPWSYIESGHGSDKNTFPLYHSANNWISYFKNNDGKYVEACIKVVDHFEFICNEAMHIYYKDRRSGSSTGSGNTGSGSSKYDSLICKWGTIRKNFSEKKYSEAGYGLLKNIAVILASEKLNSG